MALTPLHVQNYCLSSSNRCKHLELVTDNKTYNAHYLCTKLCQGKSPKQPYGTGDNCKGYLYLKHVKQGYDVKS